MARVWLAARCWKNIVYLQRIRNLAFSELSLYFPGLIRGQMSAKCFLTDKVLERMPEILSELT